MWPKHPSLRTRELCSTGACVQPRTRYQLNRNLPSFCIDRPHKWLGSSSQLNIQTYICTYVVHTYLNYIHTYIIYTNTITYCYSLSPNCPSLLLISNVPLTSLTTGNHYNDYHLSWFYFMTNLALQPEYRIRYWLGHWLNVSRFDSQQ